MNMKTKIINQRTKMKKNGENNVNDSIDESFNTMNKGKKTRRKSVKWKNYRK